MVKKKYTGPKAKKSTGKSTVKPKSLHMPKMKWYVWPLLGLLVVVVGNMTYKYLATKQDVALLDKAENKLRQLDLPGGQEGIVERYCSEKSVKFGSAGKPTCGIGVTISFSDPTNIAELDLELDNRQVDLKVDNENASYKYYSLSDFQSGLNCNLSIDNNEVDTTKSAYIYCQKEFQTKVYPIRN